MTTCPATDRTVALVLGAVLVLATGCGAAPHAEDKSQAPAPTTAAQAPAGALPAELQGTWLVELTRAQIRRDLRDAGLGRFADRFTDAERLGPRVRMAVSYAQDSFEIAWLQPDASWQVGWYGMAREEGDVLTVTDAESLASETYRWSFSGDALTLQFKSTTTPDQHGIPFEVYSRAYFTRPLQRTECTPTDLDACL